MDENLAYSSSEGDSDRRNSSQWQLAQESLMSMERDSSKQFLQYRNYHLHLIQKKEALTERPMIPSSKQERLSYYRTYLSSPNKMQIASMHLKTFNVLFWEYLLNTLFKSLQHTFVNMFLAAYVPEEHLFLSKMIPFMHGSKFSLVITGLVEIIAHIANIVILFDYVVGGIFLKNPWNTCPREGFRYKNPETNDVVKVNCYNFTDFERRVENKTVIFFKGFYYIAEDKELFQLVQIEYFRHRSNTISRVVLFVYTCITWILIALCHKQIFKKNFWRTLNVLHWCSIGMDIASYIYLLLYFREDKNAIRDINAVSSIATVAFSHSDIDFYAESTTAPPVVHVLTARSSQEIKPGQDSAVMILSNAICFLFRALLSFRVKRYCESLIKIPILMPLYSVNAWLYFWPMFFSTFFLGDMYTLLFLSSHYALELMSTVITFQCLVEVIVGEWSNLKRWKVTLALIVVAIAFAALTPINFTLLLAFNKSTATMLECFVLYCMYPVFRLIDDISFHYASPIHMLRQQLLVFVPMFYAYKYYELMYTTVTILLSTLQKKEIISDLIWALSLMIIPLVFGMIYAYCKYVLKNKKDWKRMFAPVEEWGPRDYNTRRLRKDYDSRTYNNSEAHRNLSRYIIGKAESKAYRLDIRYDPNRRSTVANFAQTEKEMKDTGN